jgi:ribosomal protein S27E
VVDGVVVSYPDDGPFMEIDCPRCGCDHDIAPPPKHGDVVHCPGCGLLLTDEVLAKANIGEWRMEWVTHPNPWRGESWEA